jgi:hypothetical protein
MDVNIIEAHDTQYKNITRKPIILFNKLKFLKYGIYTQLNHRKEQSLLFISK